MGCSLPIDAILDRVVDVLQRHDNLVIEAPPGAGKTTRVPAALLRLGDGDVVVLEPRRLAARMAARTVAREMGQQPGGTVGYQVRFEECGGQQTRLWYVTEGVLTRRLLSNPELRGVATVVLDEFHERHIDTDLAIALLRRLQRTARPDLKIVVMSATLEARTVAGFLGGAESLRAEGRRHPLSIEYTSHPALPLEQQVASACERLSRAGIDGDVLVFLPGAAEIRRCARACAALAGRAGMDVLPLHGDLTPAEQDRAVLPASKRKLILSTNVAESSITIEGVTAVIDSGLARAAADSPWTGLPSLNIARISRASAQQRAGRAGRVRPGRVIRLYTEEDYARRPEHDVPEIVRRELSHALLDLLAMGAPDLDWFQAPPEASLAAARELLERLGAAHAGHLTETGREMARLPLHPRLARMVVEAQRLGAGDAGCLAAALLSTGERVDSPPPHHAASDLFVMMEREWQPATRRTYEQIRRGVRGKPSRGGTEEALLQSVLTGFPDRVAKRRQGREYLLPGGGSAQLAETSAVANEDLIVVIDVDVRRDRSLPVIRIASAIRAEWLLDLFSSRLEQRSSVDWNRTAERVEAVSALLYDGLVIDETRGGTPDGSAAGDLLAAKALEEDISRFVDREELDSLLARVAFAAERSNLPPLGMDQVREALCDLCRGKRSFAELARDDLIAAVGARAPGLAGLEQMAPRRLRLPGGRQVRVHYEPGKPPWIASRLQDFFGMRETPRVCGDPVVVHLLAPNHRPLQMTTDLAGFWDRLYPQVRRELSRKYPKHSWPERPSQGAGTPGQKYNR